MSVDDVFIFIPNHNDDNSSEDMLLCQEREDDQLNGKVFGVIKIGNKCVPHSKVNPKQRRGIATISSDLVTENNSYAPTADRILWSDYDINVKRLARRPRDDFPLTEAELSVGCNLLVHFCGTEERIITYDVTSSRLVDLPLDLDFEVLCDGQKMQMNQVASRRQLPARVKVIEHVTNVDDVTGHVLVVKGKMSSPYLVCSSVSAGWVDHSGLLVVPDVKELKFKIGKGLRGASELEWLDFVGMLKRSVRHQLDQRVSGYPGIIFQEMEKNELELTLEQTNHNLPAYTNVVMDYTKESGTTPIIDNGYLMDTLRPTTHSAYENFPPSEKGFKTKKKSVEDWDGLIIPAPPAFTLKFSSSSSSSSSASSVIPAHPADTAFGDGDNSAISGAKPLGRGNNLKNASSEFQNRIANADDNHNKNINNSNNNNKNGNNNSYSKLSSSRSQQLQEYQQLVHSAPATQASANIQPSRPPTGVTNKPSSSSSSSSPTTTQTRLPSSALTTSDNFQIPDNFQRPDNFQIPDDITHLSSAEVEKCLKVIGLEQYCRDLRVWSLDGKALSNMDSKEMERDMNMSPFDAAKLSRFIRGWRP